MTKYTASVIWQRGNAVFCDNQYSRAHRWCFDGGIEIPASSSPHIVPLPLSSAAAVDPEEAFIAALSSCHMLWFLSIVAKCGHIVDKYLDQAEGTLARNADAQLAMTVVTLRPQVWFSGAPVKSRRELEELHRQAHDACFIAASVKSELRCEPIWPEET